MPIYEYMCPNCGKFEVIQKVSDEPLKECPNCKEKGKSVEVKKLISESSFVLKGSGWYETDYAKGHHSSGTLGGDVKHEKHGNSCSCDGCCKHN